MSDPEALESRFCGPASAYVLRHGPTRLVSEIPGRRKANRIESAWCEWNGQRFEVRSGHGALCQLARALVAAVPPDGAWCSVTMAGTPSLSGPSLFGLARLTVSETDIHGIRLAPYVERPDYRPQPTSNPTEAAERLNDTGFVVEPAETVGCGSMAGRNSASPAALAEAA